LWVGRRRRPTIEHHWLLVITVEIAGCHRFEWNIAANVTYN
jgi:hypothetical protein